MCDICKQNGDTTVPAQYDGATVFGPWANMCVTHFTLYGQGLGLGVGQRLVLEEPEKVGLSEEPVMVKLTTPKCMLCGETSVVELTREEFAMLAHPSRPLIQDCLPGRDAAFRELVKTGTHDSCWNLMMPKDGDE
jgi:hypothetical protein